jgi:sec-independent protein translocase protein TatA
MFGLGAGEILLILLFALIFIGPKKLPELARGLGKGIREFQKAKDDLLDSTNNMVDETKSDSLPTGVDTKTPDMTQAESETQEETETQEVKKES